MLYWQNHLFFRLVCEQLLFMPYYIFFRAAETQMIISDNTGYIH